MSTERVMLLIDADNVSLDVMDQAVRLLLKQHGALHVRRAYCTAESALKHQAVFKYLGIKPMVNLAAGKNSTDIALAVDAIDLVLAERPDVVVIASSDSDFAPLVQRLREKGCVVRGIGQMGKTGEETQGVYDDYTVLEHRKGPDVEGAPARRAAGTPARRAGGRASARGEGRTAPRTEARTDARVDSRAENRLESRVAASRAAIAREGDPQAAGPRASAEPAGQGNGNGNGSGGRSGRGSRGGRGRSAASERALSAPLPDAVGPPEAADLEADGTSGVLATVPEAGTTLDQPAAMPVEAPAAVSVEESAEALADAPAPARKTARKTAVRKAAAPAGAAGGAAEAAAVTAATQAPARRAAAKAAAKPAGRTATRSAPHKAAEQSAPVASPASPAAPAPADAAGLPDATDQAMAEGQGAPAKTPAARKSAARKTTAGRKAAAAVVDDASAAAAAAAPAPAPAPAPAVPPSPAPALAPAPTPQPQPPQPRPAPGRGPGTVQAVLNCLPELTAGSPLALNVAVQRLREAQLLGKNTSSLKFFAQLAERFELTPAGKPTQVRLRR